MKRVLIVGCAGAGKSTFAKKLSRQTGLPIIHLDKIYWKPGWLKPDKQEFKLRVSQLTDNGGWIMDGNYKSTLAMRLVLADTVIFLDLDRITCILNVLKRTIRYHGTVREDMPQGCPERFDWQFVKYIWEFPRVYRPQLGSGLIKLTP